MSLFNERLTNTLSKNSSVEFSLRLRTALKISRENKDRVAERFRSIVQEPALAITLLTMRAGQIARCNWLLETPVNVELSSFEGKPYWKSPELRLEAIRHGVTMPLMLVSIGALEAVALTTASFVAGINPFSETDPKFAIAGLVASYGFWFVGMGMNAKQAWNLLEETGVCQSWWAKVGHDTSKGLTDNQAIQKTATYVGFSALEAVKEIPWWAAAFGGKIVIDQNIPDYNTNNIEYAFLMGANVGAAFYNLAQAGGIRTVLSMLKKR